MLAVSWAMPPMLAPRALQVSRLLKGLGRLGWESAVICADRVPGMPVDETLGRVYERAYDRLPVIYGRRPGGILTRLGIGGAKAVEDEATWTEAATRAALRLARRGRFDVLASFAQPWSDLLVGLSVKRATGIPWVAHFSDPWSDSPYYDALDDRTRALWVEQEAQVVADADAVVFTTRETLDLVMAKHPARHRDKAWVVSHAFDPELLYAVGRYPAAPAGIRRIVHAGDFYEGKRTPTVLLEALVRLQRDPRWAGRIELVLVGTVPSPHLAEISALGLEGCVRTLGRKPFFEALAVSASADLLVIVDAKAEVNVFLPSKSVDYLMVGKPVVGLTPRRGATAGLLVEAGFETAEPDDAAGAAEAMDRALRRIEDVGTAVGSTAAVAAKHHIDHVAPRFAAVAQAAMSRK